MGGFDFPTWFTSGCYAGLACCLLASAANALYTALRKRGTTLQLATSIILCVISALLLLPALFWYNLRFSASDTGISLLEVQALLIYVALWGWLLPCGVTTTYCLYSLPRSSITAMRIPRQQHAAPAVSQRQASLIPAPFVYDATTPWGWLEYSNGSFHGQRLELKRTVVTLGRDESCDIWIDDDKASRHHAELSWHEQKVYLTDCASLNGVLLNGKRIRATVQIAPNDFVEIGSYCFTFVLAEPQQAVDDASDPLAHHTWRSVAELTSGGSVSVNQLPIPQTEGERNQPAPALPVATLPQTEHPWQRAITQGDIMPVATRPANLLRIHDGALSGQTFALDRPIRLLGRGFECDIVMNDPSISRQHTQFIRQAEGDYIQDLTSRNGTLVNNESLRSPRLLRHGDHILVGNIHIEYVMHQYAQPAPASLPASSLSAPVPLRLPSRPRQLDS